MGDLWLYHDRLDDNRQWGGAGRKRTEPGADHNEDVDPREVGALEHNVITHPATM